MISPLLQMALAGMVNDRMPSTKSTDSVQSFEDLIAGLETEREESGAFTLEEVSEPISGESESELDTAEQTLSDVKIEVVAPAESMLGDAKQVLSGKDDSSFERLVESADDQSNPEALLGDLAFADNEKMTSEEVTVDASLEKLSELPAIETVREDEEIPQLSAEGILPRFAVNEETYALTDPVTELIPVPEAAEQVSGSNVPQQAIDSHPFERSVEVISSENGRATQVQTPPERPSIRQTVATSSIGSAPEVQKIEPSSIEPEAYELEGAKENVAIMKDTPVAASSVIFSASAASSNAVGSFSEQLSAIAVTNASDVRQSAVTPEVPSAPSSAAKVNLTLPQVEEVVQVAVASGLESKIEIELQPLDLGRMKLTFKQDAQGMSVVVEAEKPETIDQIRRHLEHTSLDQRSGPESQPRFRFESGGFEQSGRERQGGARQGKPSRGQISADDTMDVANEPSRPTHTTPYGSLDIKA